MKREELEAALGVIVYDLGDVPIQAWRVIQAAARERLAQLGRIDMLKSLVEEQAQDEGLWFLARTAPEAYLQQELRRLHALIERDNAVLDALNTESVLDRNTKGTW